VAARRRPLGIRRATADVRGVTIGFAEAFTIDDFTYSGLAPIDLALELPSP
jgi:hypothetical protein